MQGQFSDCLQGYRDMYVLWPAILFLLASSRFSASHPERDNEVNHHTYKLRANQDKATGAETLIKGHGNITGDDKMDKHSPNLTTPAIGRGDVTENTQDGHGDKDSNDTNLDDSADHILNVNKSVDEFVINNITRSPMVTDLDHGDSHLNTSHGHHTNLNNVSHTDRITDDKVNSNKSVDSDNQHTSTAADVNHTNTTRDMTNISIPWPIELIHPSLKVTSAEDEVRSVSKNNTGFISGTSRRLVSGDERKVIEPTKSMVNTSSVPTSPPRLNTNTSTSNSSAYNTSDSLTQDADNPRDKLSILKDKKNKKINGSPIKPTNISQFTNTSQEKPLRTEEFNVSLSLNRTVTTHKQLSNQRRPEKFLSYKNDNRLQNVSISEFQLKLRSFSDLFSGDDEKSGHPYIDLQKRVSNGVHHAVKELLQGWFELTNNMTDSDMQVFMDDLIGRYKTVLANETFGELQRKLIESGHASPNDHMLGVKSDIVCLEEATPPECIQVITEIQNESSWYGADQKCREMQGSLFELDSEHKQKVLETFLKNSHIDQTNTTRLWVGMDALLNPHPGEETRMVHLRSLQSQTNDTLCLNFNPSGDINSSWIADLVDCSTMGAYVCEIRVD